MLNVSRRNVEDAEDMLETFRQRLLSSLEASNGDPNKVTECKSISYIDNLRKILQAIRRWTALLKFCESISKIDEGIYNASHSLAAKQDDRIVVNRGLSINNRALTKATTGMCNRLSRGAPRDPIDAFLTSREACADEYNRLRNTNESFAKREDRGSRVEQEIENLNKDLKDWKQRRREAIITLHDTLETVAKDDDAEGLSTHEGNREELGGEFKEILETLSTS